MNFYDRHVLPYLIDWACGMRAVERRRMALIPQARGRVLEIGIGTGLNLAHYDPQVVTAFYGLDPAVQMHRLARRRASEAGLDVTLVELPAERINLPDASFDTVVTTFTLCSIPEPLAALREMRRVLKPDGRLLYCEHGRAPDASVRAWQDRLTPWWKPLAGGCHLNRDIPALLQAGGFHLHPQGEAYLPGPRPLTYNYWGTAVPA